MKSFVLLHRPAALAVALFAIALAGTPASGGEGPIGDGPAIPPGRENLLLDILGPGAALPCELIDGQVSYTVVKLTYACSGGGEVQYELAHRSRGEGAATLTDQFAITRKSGTPPPGFADALVSLIRARENEFEWIWPGDSPQ
jgi:hypothetical protein